MELKELAGKAMPQYLYRVWLFEPHRQLATPGPVFTNRKEAEKYARNDRPAEVTKFVVEVSQEIARRFK